MVAGDGVGDDFVFALLAGERAADDRVAALDLVADGLADVVQQARAPGEAHVQTELAGHQAGDVAALDRVLEHVLGVAVAVAQVPEQLGELGVQARQPELIEGLLGRLAHGALDLGLRLGDHLFDARRVDAPVGDELLEREPRHLAPHRVEARDDDGLGRVVDDEVDAGRLLQGADVAALAADDAPLHLVVGQVHRGDGALLDVVAGVALDGDADDALGAPLGLFAGDVFDELGLARRAAAHVVEQLRGQLPPRLFAAHAGDDLELALLLVDERDRPRFVRLEPRLARPELPLALGDEPVAVGHLAAAARRLEVACFDRPLFFAQGLFAPLRALLFGLPAGGLGVAHLLGLAARLGLGLGLGALREFGRLEAGLLRERLGVELGLLLQRLGLLADDLGLERRARARLVEQSFGLGARGGDELFVAAGALFFAVFEAAGDLFQVARRQLVGDEITENQADDAEGGGREGVHGGGAPWPGACPEGAPGPGGSAGGRAGRGGGPPAAKSRASVTTQPRAKSPPVAGTSEMS